MGDVLSLIEKAEQAIDKDEAEQLEEKLRKNEFTLDDFRAQLKTIRRMGPLESVLGMIPGLGNLKQLAENKPDEKQMGRVEAIICSMTPAERRNDTMINGSRRQADCRRQRHVGRRGESAAQAVHRDAAGAADDRAGRNARHGSRGHEAAEGCRSERRCGAVGQEAQEGWTVGAHQDEMTPGGACERHDRRAKDVEE